MSLHMLPFEILAEIFTCVGRRTIHSLYCVCKDFQAICRTVDPVPEIFVLDYNCQSLCDTCHRYSLLLFKEVQMHSPLGLCATVGYNGCLYAIAVDIKGQYWPLVLDLRIGQPFEWQLLPCTKSLGECLGEERNESLREARGAIVGSVWYLIEREFVLAIDLKPQAKDNLHLTKVVCDVGHGGRICAWNGHLYAFSNNWLYRFEIATRQWTKLKSLLVSARALLVWKKRLCVCTSNGDVHIWDPTVEAFTPYRTRTHLQYAMNAVVLKDQLHLVQNTGDVMRYLPDKSDWVSSQYHFEMDLNRFSTALVI